MTTYKVPCCYCCNRPLTNETIIYTFYIDLKVVKICPKCIDHIPMFAELIRNNPGTYEFDLRSMCYC